MGGAPLTSPTCEIGHEAEGCITCGDVAVPLTVVRIDSRRELALCEAEDGRRETVEIALVTPVAPGDELLVHAGTAIA
jgi:hydrogenase maturation factor